MIIKFRIKLYLNLKLSLWRICRCFILRFFLIFRTSFWPYRRLSFGRGFLNRRSTSASVRVSRRVSGNRRDVGLFRNSRGVLTLFRILTLIFLVVFCSINDSSTDGATGSSFRFFGKDLFFFLILLFVVVFIAEKAKITDRDFYELQILPIMIIQLHLCNILRLLSLARARPLSCIDQILWHVLRSVVVDDFPFFCPRDAVEFLRKQPHHFVRMKRVNAHLWFGRLAANFLHDDFANGVSFLSDFDRRTTDG